MKKFLLTLMFISGFVITNAQTEKGDWMVGGSFQLNTSGNDTRIAFAPNAGLFVISNLAVGGNVLFDYSKNGDNKRTDFGVGPFVRYYFTKANIRPILQASFNFLSSRNKTPLSSNTENGASYFLGGGIAAFISDQVSIDGVLGYSHSKYEGFDGSSGFAMTIGFQVYILKRQMDKVRGE